MELDGDYGNNSEEIEQEDDIIWQDDEMMQSTGPEGPGPGPGDYCSNIQFNNRGGYRRGGGYGKNGPPRFFGPRGPPGPPGPPFMWGRGFGPGGPPMQQRFPRDNKPFRYLMRCGVPKSQLKGVPKSLLRLMEPQYCGLCSHGFDNFAMSRLHYISKNHMKNQKKWLSQQTDVGSHRPSEIPLKSRELYCELCDVHITSKSHAESHYAGKPHRAIVEGRKDVKNPSLLQRGMQNRVDQLIRREKKHLKPVEAPEVSPEVKQDSKLIQTELYCDICKTSVTCTEQMTMHLNGKRHLAKEKHHILKMMKGESTEKPEKPAEVDEGNKAEKAEADDAVAGDAEAGDAEAGDAEVEDADVEDADVEDADVEEAEVEDAEEDAEPGNTNAGDGDVQAENGEVNDKEDVDKDDWVNGGGNWDDPQ